MGASMPQLLVDFITSLDGYASAEGWPGFWGLEVPEYLGPGIDEHLEQVDVWCTITNEVTARVKHT